MSSRPRSSRPSNKRERLRRVAAPPPLGGPLRGVLPDVAVCVDCGKVIPASELPLEVRAEAIARAGWVEVPDLVGLVQGMEALRRLEERLAWEPPAADGAAL